MKAKSWIGLVLMVFAVSAIARAGYAQENKITDLISSILRQIITLNLDQF